MFSLNFRDMLQGISEALVGELEQIAASAQGKWYPQHDDSGRHTEVTATSCVASGLLSGGRLALSESANTTASETVSGTLTIKVVSPAAPTAIVSIAPSQSSDITLWGLSTVGRTFGELVILRAAYDYGLTHFGFVIRSNSSLTMASDAAKFFIPGDGTGTNYDAITLAVGESLLVRLESAPLTPTTAYGTYWRVLGKLSV